MLTAARVVVAPVAAVPADRRSSVRRCVVAAAHTRPLRRAALAWRAHPRPSILAGRAAVAASARGDADDRAEGSASHRAELEGPSPEEGRSASRASDGAPNPSVSSEDAITSALVFGRSSGRIEPRVSPAGPPRSVLGRAPAESSNDGRAIRAGKAALVSVAAALASAGAARAAQANGSRLEAHGTVSTRTSSHHSSDANARAAKGAADLGMLLAESSGSESEAEAAARAKKLAEVRRIKAERAKQLQKRKKTEDKKDADAEPAASARRGSNAREEDSEKTPAEKRKAERVAKAKEKAFAEALARERAAARSNEDGDVSETFDDVGDDDSSGAVAPDEGSASQRVALYRYGILSNECSARS
jgi:hypothetical protein